MFGRTNPHQKVSFAQSGEDIIIKFIFDALNIPRPSYLDIGAHHPEYLSNTKIFYDTASTGINIEADPELCAAFTRARPRDLNLNLGIGRRRDTLDFYRMSAPGLSTFSRQDALEYERQGHPIAKVTPIAVYPIEEILDEQYEGRMPHFLTLDVEGLDFEILQSIDYRRHAPMVICVETITYSPNGHGRKNTEIPAFLAEQGYMAYADTNINTIFVQREAWQR